MCRSTASRAASSAGPAGSNWLNLVWWRRVGDPRSEASSGRSGEITGPTVDDAEGRRVPRMAGRAARASPTAASSVWSSVASMTTIKVYTNSTGVDTYDDAAYNVNNANAVLTVTDHKA